MSKVIELALKIEQERDTYKKVLQEFCQDVQAGGPNIKEEWPDLYVTYQHAQEALRGKP